MAIDRARMRLRLVLPVREARKVREKIKSSLASVEQEDWTPDLEIVKLFWCNYIYNIICLSLQICLIDPGSYRNIDEVVRSDTKGKGTVEVLSLKDVEEGDERLQ